DGGPDPEPDGERLLPPGRSVALPDQFRSAYERGGSLELLGGQQAQRVAHEHSDAVASVKGAVVRLNLALQPPNGERIRREPQVGLGLAATGREEQQLKICCITATVRMGRVGQ